MRPKGSAEELEVRRRLAARLLLEGRGIREVARLVGAAPASVYRWKQVLEREGMEGLKARPHPGRRPRLSAEQKQRLRAILVEGPRAAGFATDLWTLSRVKQVIERTFGVSYHPSHVWRLLRELKFTPPEARARARERDEAAIERWHREEWPRIKKSPPGRPDPGGDRRDGVHAAAAGAPHLGAAGTDAHPVRLGPSRSSLGHLGHHAGPPTVVVWASTSSCMNKTFARSRWRPFCASFTARSAAGCW